MILQLTVILCQFVHAKHDYIRSVLVFGGQLPDNGNTIHNSITGGFDLLYGCDDTLQIGFDAVCQCTVRFVQMTDGHNVADIA